MISYTALLVGFCSLLPPTTSAWPIIPPTPPSADPSILPICNETDPSYSHEDRKAIFDEVVGTLPKKSKPYYACSLEKLAAEVWKDSQAGKEEFDKQHIQKFKYKSQVDEFVKAAVNKWDRRFQNNKQKTYMGCYHGKKNNGNSKAVCLFI
ncbi:hypothetical protein ANCCAN_23248 [Ancylostoma caninum]|uniref:SCP domain-containing protein n=1 Tax=Ancylostoma caninum TaxID=29170 RepID=A0A368FFP2_ANCCA|nr:hypothetical protein ANCCAN_23248 [Ancylostoma caninum]